MAIEVPENVVVSKLDNLASWCRKNSLWPMPFATACCGIELMATGASRHDKAVQAAVQAGGVRRGYLKGVGMRMNCAPPAAPSWFVPAPPPRPPAPVAAPGPMAWLAAFWDGVVSWWRGWWPF